MHRSPAATSASYPASPEPGKRRRRSRAAASGEIIAAAEAFLRERPFRELSVEEVMARTSLSRSSFYVYFRDRHDLLLHLVQQIGDEIYAVADRWYHGSGDPRVDMRVALEGVVEVYDRHGSVLRAISDTAALDPEVEEVYQALVSRFVQASRQRIEQEIAAGRIEGVDPSEIAFALVWMAERYLRHTLGGPEPRVPKQVAARTLNDVWVRALY